jgi:putative transcriptional regulator
MAVLHDDAARGVKLMIGRMPPGKVFPRHEHLGFEQMVVLAGGYDDERGEFVAGDYAVYEPGSAHGPQTLDGDDCWILFRIDGPVRFRGWRGLVQRLAGG